MKFFYNEDIKKKTEKGIAAEQKGAPKQKEVQQDKKSTQ
jgi:hypothetical protein